jgi:transposase-like protein
MEARKPRRHSREFRIEIAQRMLAGESVSALSQRHQLTRSLMYRWRDAYRKYGPEGLARPTGRPPGLASARAAGCSTEDHLRQRISELERKIGQQSVEIDFFKGVFKRVEELPKTTRSGGGTSTRRSNE